jgi:serpin B
MSIAFTGQADFSGMDGSRDLFIDEVYHKAFVAVDETGTEAAAATGVPMRETALPPKRFELTIDRPFIFLIRDLPTGAVLFMGYIGDPRGQG